MLSDHFQNGVETAKLMWSRIPATEEEEVGEVGTSRKGNGSTVESLDYEVVENFAYREEQVGLLSKAQVLFFVLFKDNSFMLLILRKN